MASVRGGLSLTSPASNMRHMRDAAVVLPAPSMHALTPTRTGGTVVDARQWEGEGTGCE